MFHLFMCAGGIQSRYMALLIPVLARNYVDVRENKPALFEIQI